METAIAEFRKDIQRANSTATSANCNAEKAQARTRKAASIVADARREVLEARREVQSANLSASKAQEYLDEIIERQHDLTKQQLLNAVAIGYLAGSMATAQDGNQRAREALLMGFIAGVVASNHN
ncbi:hypothetical protein N0V92_013479 [Colletotrichum tropicale]|nr:hypothetical protein N0V92_013479 [Colletotrichum tropicale]